MLNHHPSPELLSDYVSGSLRLSHALCVSSHLEHCSDCRQQAGRLNQLGAQFFNQQEPQESSQSDQLKSKVMAFLDSSEASGIEVTEPVREVRTAEEQGGYRVPNSLRQFVSQGYDKLDWVQVSPSFKIATLLRDKDGAQIALSRVKPGGKMPHHRHTGDELTMVLEGSFSDENGIYRKGDFISRDRRHKHRPVVTKDAECICLMVIDAPIEFTGWVSRLLNPLVRRHHSHG